MHRVPSWVWAAVICGAFYLAIGIVFGGLGSSAETRILWRRAAWVVSAVVFAVHIAYEHFRRRSQPRTTGLHVAAAVALGTFGLAVSANIHAQPTTRQRLLVAAALVIWPALTAIPAFVVAFVMAALLGRTTRSTTR